MDIREYYFFSSFHTPVATGSCSITDVARQDSREEKNQQPFPPVFRCHALKIAPNQLLLNKWI